MFWLSNRKCLLDCVEYWLLILTYLQFCESSPLRATKACNLLLLSRCAPQICRCVTSIKTPAEETVILSARIGSCTLLGLFQCRDLQGQLGLQVCLEVLEIRWVVDTPQCSWCFYPTAFLMLVPFWEYISITWLNRDCFASDVGKWNAVFFSQYVGVTTCGIFPRALWCFDITGTGTIEIVLGRKCL